MQKEWFETWFDSPYYHVLYDHRDEREAESFILNLVNALKVNGNHRVLDLACGAGRYSAFLSKFAGEVVGLDLSLNSIQQAEAQYQADNLEFYVHDMRLPFRINYFDIIFNFFTSFGYFKNPSDNLKVLRAMAKGLSDNGRILIDFMNSEKVVARLKPNETLVKQEIAFRIRREVVQGQIRKHIHFTDRGKTYEHTESVQALTADDFRRMLKQSGFEVIREYGNYELEPFQAEHSDRYIVLAGHDGSDI